MAEGAGNAAAYSLFQARGLSWTSDSIDKELDGIEVRLDQQGADPAALMAKNNLKHDLAPIRHRNALNGEFKESVPSEERAKACARFELSETEKNALAKRQEATDNGSVSLRRTTYPFFVVGWSILGLATFH